MDSNPIFGFYGVESFTGFEAGFEFPRIRTLSLKKLLRNVNKCYQTLTNVNKYYQISTNLTNVN